MTNAEKYLNEILNTAVPCAVHTVRTGNPCIGRCDCDTCKKKNIEWLNAEYEEPETESKTALDMDDYVHWEYVRLAE